MDINQLKLVSADGKSYMADVADAPTIIKIIQIVAPYSAPAFRAWFDHIDAENSQKQNNVTQQNTPVVTLDTEILDTGLPEISTALVPGVDIYKNNNSIVVKLMVPGADPQNISIVVNMHTLTIKGARLEPINISANKYSNLNSTENINKENYQNNYITKELQWGEFYKKIDLPELIDVDNVSAVEFQGLITITLPAIDQEKTRFIKIKSI